MYISYVPSASATAVEVWQDFCNILVNTPISSLSQSCNKTASVLKASSVASPWTLHDGSVSATAKVFKSLNADGVTYKYLHVSYSSTNIVLALYETWNASTHTGTNQAAYGTTILATPTLQTVTTSGIVIFANLRTTVVTQPALARSYLIGEFSRECPSLNASYPCTFIAGLDVGVSVGGTGVYATATGSNFAAICRAKYVSNLGDMKYGSTPAGAKQFAGLGPFVSNASMSYQPEKIIPAGTEISTYVARPLYVFCSSEEWVAGGSYAIRPLGKVPEVLAMAVTSGAWFDEIDINGMRYVMMHGIVIPKG